MKENDYAKMFLSVLQQIADELALIRQSLKPAAQPRSDEEQAEEIERIKYKIFGD